MSKNLDTRILIVFTICSMLSLNGVLTQKADSPMQCSEKGNDVNSQCSENNNQEDVKTVNENKYTQFKGHLMPFGESGSKSKIQTVIGFPKTNFFLDYVLPSIPILMKGAATLSPAFDKWTTDDYLLRLASLPKNRFQKFTFEEGKKENRTGGGGKMTFYDFLKVYNSSDIYMVSDVAPFMEPILMMPCPLQCRELKQIPILRVMWFSSGGTKSVVHTDHAENFNCLYRGRKTLVMLDPAKISSGSIIDVFNGGYSSLDVERVDLNHFPTLKGANFVIANMEAGDCIYIPHHWIHHVESFGSNLAVNVWFHQELTHETIGKGHCTGPDLVCDPTFTLARVQHPELNIKDTIIEDRYLLQTSLDVFRSFFELSSLRGKASTSPENPPLRKSDEKVKLKEFVLELIENLPLLFPELEGQKEEIPELLYGLDIDGDGVLTSFEFEHKIESIGNAILSVAKRVSGKKDDDNDNDYDDDDDDDGYYGEMNDESTYNVNGGNTMGGDISDDESSNDDTSKNKRGGDSKTI